AEMRAAVIRRAGREALKQADIGPAPEDDRGELGDQRLPAGRDGEETAEEERDPELTCEHPTRHAGLEHAKRASVAGDGGPLRALRPRVRAAAPVVQDAAAPLGPRGLRKREPGGSTARGPRGRACPGVR